jgi:TolB-like protein
MSDLGPFLQHVHAELRRRRVFRVTGAYAAAGFVAWQAADIAFPALGLPPWTMTFVVVMVLLGFPVVIVMAWIFDVTPTGLRRTEPVAVPEPANAAAAADGAGDDVASKPRPRAASRPAAIAAVASVVILAVAAAAFALRPGSLGGDAAAELSIVVLPFANQSGDEGNEYFSDGVAEAILGRLNRIDNLRVISRTSAMSYKGTTKRVSEIGTELGVAYIVEGSVSRAGNRVRIHVQLIEAATDRTLWSDSFNRELDDIFALETEISERIAGALTACATSRPDG